MALPCAHGIVQQWLLIHVCKEGVQATLGASSVCCAAWMHAEQLLCLCLYCAIMTGVGHLYTSMLQVYDSNGIDALDCHTAAKPN